MTNPQSQQNRSTISFSPGLNSDDRGTTTAVEYAITLGLGALLLISITSGMTSVVSTQEERVTQEQMRVLGERLVSDANTADRFLRETDAGQGDTYESVQKYPSKIVTTGYQITLNQTHIALESTDGSVSYTSKHDVVVPINNSTIRGGDVRFAWNGEELILQSAGMEPPENNITPTQLNIAITDTNEPVPENNTMFINTTVTNDGPKETTQWVTLSIDNTREYATQVTVAPNESQTVSLEWDTVSGDAGEYEAEVQTDDDSANQLVTVSGFTGDFDVALKEVNDPVKEGKTMNFTTNVTNNGDGEAVQRVKLDIDGTQVDSKGVSLAVNETKQITLQWTPGSGAAGDHTGKVYSEDDSGTKTVTVEEGPAPVFNVRVDNINDPVDAGDTMKFTTTVTNNGDSAGEQYVTLDTNGTERDKKLVSLDVGESKQIQLNWNTRTGDVGDTSSTVSSKDDSKSNTVTVEEPAQANFAVNITSHTAEVSEGDVVTYEADITNTGETTERQGVVLKIDGGTVDGVSVELAPGEETTVVLKWQTQDGDGGKGRSDEVYTGTVESSDDSDSADVIVRGSGGNG